MRPPATKKSFASTTTLVLIALTYSSATPANEYYQEIKQQVFSKPYEALPSYQVSKKLFGKSGNHENNYLLQAARRTLTSKEDLLDFPHGQKLLQANGICFAGQWIIDAPSPYTGQYSFPTQTPVIARASVALSGTLHTDIRAFGFALKLFPNTSTKNGTLNAFVINSMGGARSHYALDYEMDNAPALGNLPSFSQLSTAYRLLRDLKAADRSVSQRKPDASFRPVSHLAVSNQEKITVAPTWLRLKAADNLPRIDESDFREELRVEHYPQRRLTWFIEVAKDESGDKKKANWQHVGKLVFDQSITSKACDQRLHFPHPSLDE